MEIDIRSFAEAGARTRLQELRDETDRILRAFPDLATKDAVRRPGRPSGQAEAAPASRRRVMSAAERKSVSERMRRYWAARRQAKSAAAETAAEASPKPRAARKGGKKR
jgi:hypothetical protein